ncbi:chloride channel CLIC-like protein 1 [Watersipora subatra]|uniref:chloride channel CLIC-like protein 1 n=1 Tax=Watersipora subatra TaxID=2589382 RepID=UPI00355B1DAF
MVSVWKVIVKALLCYQLGFCMADEFKKSQPRAAKYKSEFKDPLDPFDKISVAGKEKEDGTKLSKLPDTSKDVPTSDDVHGKHKESPTDGLTIMPNIKDATEEILSEDLDKNHNAIRSCAADNVFTRRMILSLLNHIKQEAADGEYLASLSIQSHSLGILREFAKSELISIDEATEIFVDSVNYIQATQPFTENALSWLAGYESTITSSLQILLIIFFTVHLIRVTMGLWRWLGWRPFLIFLLITSFLVSVPWTWVHLYKQKLAERLQRADQRITTPPDCDPQRLSIANLVLWFSTTDTCQKYYQDQMIDPLWEVKPTTAIAVTFVEFFWEPLRIMGGPLAEFINEVLEPLPFYLKPFVSVFGLVFLWWCMVLVSGMRVWTWFFTVEPAVTAQHQLTAMQHTVDQMQQFIQEVGNSNLERDSRLQNTLERLEEQVTCRDDVKELLPVLHDMCADYGQRQNNVAPRAIHSTILETTSASGQVGPAGDGVTVAARLTDAKFGLNSVDHIVLTTNSITVISEYYEKLGMTLTTFGNDRKALHFGTSKINIHQLGKEVEPHAKQPKPGSLDICLVCSCNVKTTLNHLQEVNINKELGPVERTGARGKITSVYIRDPDHNLIELAHYNRSTNTADITTLG